MNSRLTSNPDSISFTTDELADLVVCVDYALRAGAGYGHATPEEEAPLEAAREAMLARLRRVADASKKRNALRARKERSS